MDNSSTLLDDSLVCRLSRDNMVPWSPVRPPCFMTIMVEWWSLFFFTAVYFWFLVGWGTCVLYWGAHVVTSPWEFTQIVRPFMLFLPLGGPITCVFRQLLVSSTDPTAYQFRLACAPTPWVGMKKAPDHTDWPDWWYGCSCFEMPRASISICYICWADRMSKQMLCLDWGRQYR